MDWISVKDELPLKGEKISCKVRVYRYGNYKEEKRDCIEFEGSDCFTFGNWSIYEGDEDFVMVTHWKRIN